MNILLVSPFSGVIGGISIWTDNILRYISKFERNQVNLFDFSRHRNGQMISNKFSRAFWALWDYVRLTRQALKYIKISKLEVVHICSPASFLLIRDYILLRKLKGRKNVRSYIHFHFGRINELSKKK